MSQVTTLERGSYRFDEDARTRFLLNYMTSGKVYESARAAGVSEETVRHYAKHNIEGFGDLYDEAKGLFREKIESEIQRRAIEGVDEPIIGGKDRDEVVTYVKRYSDRLLELLAKRHIPEYRDKQQLDVNVSGGVMIVPGRAMTQESWIEATANERLPGGDDHGQEDQVGRAFGKPEAPSD